MFPILYHAHHSLHPEDIPFWLGLAQKYPAPVLELGCGSGRLLIPLALEGIAIFGCDNDFEMLRVLSNNLSESPRARANIFQADFTALHLAIQFGLIFLPCNTYSTLTTEQRQALLKRVFAHLLPGGAFAVSLPNPARLKRLPRRAEAEIEEVFAHPIDKEPVQVSSAWLREQDCFTVLWHYDHLFPDGTVERLTAQVKHYLTPVAQLCQELKAAGFLEPALIGDYDGAAYSASSAQLILIAKR